MKAFTSIAIVGSMIVALVHQTNYAHDGFWIDWNPDYGILVNGPVNLMVAGGCFVAAWLLIAAVDKAVECFAPEAVAIQWRRIVG